MSIEAVMSAAPVIPVIVVQEKDGAELAFGPAEEITRGLPAVFLAELFLSPEPPPPGTLRRARRTRAALAASRRFVGDPIP